MNRLFTIIVLLASIHALPAQAEELQLLDFASGMRLEAKADGGLWKTRLSQTVYEGIVRQDLGDIRVFDGQGLQVSLKIVDERTGADPSQPQGQDLNFFPLLTRADGHVDMSRVTFRMDEKGALTGVENNAAVRDGNILTSYVVDASRFAGEPTGLRLQWDDQPGKFVTSVNVEASRDLGFWFSLASEAVVAQAPCGQMLIFQDVIPIPKPVAGYWMITWPGGKKGANLTGVQAIFAPGDNGPDITWTHAAQRGEGVGGEYQFELPAPYPANEVSISVSWYDFCSRARIYSRSDQGAPWEFHADTTIYNVAADEITIKNKPIPVRPVNHRYWRIVFDPDSAASAGPLPPSFSVGWTPHQVYFIAEGTEPYTLAFGSGRDDVGAPPSNPILDPIGWGKPQVIAAQALPGAVMTLGGPSAMLKTRPQPPAPGAQRMIWIAAGILFFAFVTLLGLIVHHVAGKRKAGKAPKEEAPGDSDWAEAAAQAESLDKASLDDTFDGAAEGETKEMVDSWGLPDQSLVDDVLADSDKAIADSVESWGGPAESPSGKGPAPTPASQESVAVADQKTGGKAISPTEETSQDPEVEVQLGEDGSLEQDQLDLLLTNSGFTPGQPIRSKRELPRRMQDSATAIPSGQGGELSQDDLDALLSAELAGASPSDPAPLESDDGGGLSQADLDALLSPEEEGESQPREPSHFMPESDGTISQSALNALLVNAGYQVKVPAPSEEAGSGLPFDGAMTQNQLDKMVHDSTLPEGSLDTGPEPEPVIKQFTQEELDDLFDGAGRIEDWAPPEPDPEPEKEPEPSLPVPEQLQTGGQLSQADLDAFFDAPAKPEPAPAPKPEANAAMSQADLDALFDAPAKPEPAPAPKPKPKTAAKPGDKGVTPVFQEAGRKKSRPGSS